MLNIDIFERGDVVTLAVAGELDIATASLLDEQLACAGASGAGASGAGASGAGASGAATLVVDLDRIDFMDASGLHVLLKHVAISRQNGNRLRVTHGSVQVQRLFEVTGMAEQLPFLAG